MLVLPVKYRKRFSQLVPGDKFTLDMGNYSVDGVCVLAPVVVSEKKRLFRDPIITMTAKCVELHKYQGGVEWNPVVDSEVFVMVEEWEN